MLDEVRSRNIVIGMRRCMKTISAGREDKAFVAGDVAPQMTKSILASCKENGVPVELVRSKAELGRACRIDVDASVAVIEK